MAALLTVDDALARIVEYARLLPEEAVPVERCAGRVLRQPAAAALDLPPFPSSAMDGFAIRAADAPGELEVAFHVAAGSPATTRLPVGAAAGIATGGEVPPEADAVVPIELTDVRGGSVVIDVSATAGQHVRARGGDVHAGDTVVEAGTRLRPAQIGSLSAAGIAEVTCCVRPHVTVLATGSELRPPGSRLEPGQIYESNRAMVAAVLERAGARVDVASVVPDDPAAHREAIAKALESDVLVTTGGVSMGELDLVRRTEAELGVEEIFWGVAVKPGKPLSFGVRGETLVFGLPGNPVSALVGAMVFVTTGLLARQGAADPHPRFSAGRTSAPLRCNPERDEFVRAVTRNGAGVVELEPLGGQESHMIARAAAADALIHVPRGEVELPAGASVRFLPFD